MIIGHQKQLQLLEQARTCEKLGHAYLLSGPSKIGKKALALEWLSRISGTTLSQTSANADFVFVAPLLDPKTGLKEKEITVDQIRNLIWKLSLKPVNGKYKTAIIDEAHLMNTEAQNCLLKTLEEPPGDSLIILIAENSNRLLETIRSRCQTLRFHFVPQKEIRAYIESNGSGFDNGQLDEIIKLSFGRPGRMIEFMANAGLIRQWQVRSQEFARVIVQELPERFTYAKKITEEGDINEMLEIWQFHFRNLLMDALNPLPATVETQQKAPSKQFVFSKIKDRAYTVEEIASILKRIYDLSVILQTTNANARLALENFMLDL